MNKLKEHIIRILKEEFIPARPSLADIGFTVLYIVLMAGVVIIKDVYRADIIGKLLLIAVIIFYTWRVKGRYKSGLFLLMLIAIGYAVPGLWELCKSISNRELRIALLILVHILKYTMFFNVTCYGVYEISGAFGKMKEKRRKQ